MIKDRFEDKLTEKIYDNVHGFISLTEAEKTLLSTSYFQRLNHIKQLGLSYFVFPGSVHTRFSHSLGVLHITEKLIQKLKLEGCSNFRDTKIHQITRLAALLHDIGHYPLSHTIEKSYMEYFQHLDSIKKQDLPVTEILPTLNMLCNSSDINDFLKYYTKNKDSVINHEGFAEIIIKSEPFKKIFLKLFPDLRDSDLDIISKLITGTFIDDNYLIASKLINSKLDADQMDYMFRDTVNTGINTAIDLDYIISSITLCDKLYGANTKQVLAFSIKSIQVIEQFILSKYYWYSNILYYDKSYIVNNIAQRIYTYLLINDKVDKEYTSIPAFENILEENPNKFFFFNDNYFWDLLHKEILLKENDDNIVYKLTKMLIERKFPDVKRQEFFEENFPSQLIVPYSQILDPKSSEFKTAHKDFMSKIKNLNDAGNMYFGLCLERAIVPQQNKCGFQNDGQINISYEQNKCKNIVELQNQFFQQFLKVDEGEDEDQDQDKTKELRAFKVFDFKKILS